MIESNMPSQLNNDYPVTKFKHRSILSIEHSYFGVCARIPRSHVMEEDIWSETSLNDGSYKTPWFDEGHFAGARITAWAGIKLSKKTKIKSVRIIPWVDGAGFPLDFRIETSGDGRTWKEIVSYLDYPNPNGQKPQNFDFNPHICRFVRIYVTRLPLFSKVFWASEMKGICFFSISEIEVYDEAGQNVALTSKGGKAMVSSTNYADTSKRENVNKSFSLLLNLGIKWVRIGQWGDCTDWAIVEKEKGKYTISPVMAKAIAEGSKRGIKFMPTLAYGNDLYESSLESAPPWERFPIRKGPTTNEAIKAFGNYCYFMANYFKGQINHWEIWNEEDLGFWKPKPDPIAYSCLLKEASRRIKEANPQAEVIFGGIAAPVGGASQRTKEADPQDEVMFGGIAAPDGGDVYGFGLSFVMECLKLGVASHIDGFAFHPYRWQWLRPEGPCLFTAGAEDRFSTMYEKKLEYLLKEIRNYCPKIKFWANEQAWLVFGDPPMEIEVSPLTQAKYLLREYIINQAYGIYTFWWEFYNDLPFQLYNLIEKQTLNPRPAYYALRNLSAILSDTEPAKELRVNNNYDTLKERCLFYWPCPFKQFTFKDRNGNVYLAVWLAMRGQDNYPGKAVDFIIEERFSDGVSFDLLHGIQQKLRYSINGSQTILRDVIVRDYPLIIKLYSS